MHRHQQVVFKSPLRSPAASSFRAGGGAAWDARLGGETALEVGAHPWECEHLGPQAADSVCCVPAWAPVDVGAKQVEPGCCLRIKCQFESCSRKTQRDPLRQALPSPSVEEGSVWHKP